MKSLLSFVRPILLALPLVCGLSCGGGSEDPAQTVPPPASTPITLTANPQSQSVNVGQTATFSVTATGGSGTLAYQWYKNGTSIGSATTATYTTSAATALDDGATFHVRVSDASTSVTSAIATLTVQGGDSGGVSIPAKLEAEDYTAMTGIQAETCSEGTQNLGYIDAGDSMTYAISVPSAGTYTIRYRVASQAGGGSLRASFKGQTLGTLSLPQTSGWQTWTTVSQTVELPAGSGDFVISVVTGGWNLNWITFLSGADPVAVSISPSTINLLPGSSQTFTAEVTGSANTAVTWSAPDGGTITADGTFTAPTAEQVYRVIATSAADPGASATAQVTVSATDPFGYTIYPGFIGVDLKNGTNGAWTDEQIYVCVIGKNPATDQFSWLKPDGTLTQCAVADNDGPGHLTKNGQNYSNYFFTLAQSKLLKIPKMGSGRVFISVGSPMYLKILIDGAGQVGFAGPNVLNTSDPNLDVNFEWYELSYNDIGIWINTTQVDQFSYPLDLDVYGGNRARHKRVALTLNRAQVFSQFLTETPAAFHDLIQAPYRILAPCKGSFDAGKANGAYFDAYVNEIWAAFATQPLTLDMWNNSRRFQGTTSGNQFVFTEVDKGNGAYVGGSYSVSKPNTQEILEGKGALATGNSTELAIEAQMCAAFNRHIMHDGSLWAAPSSAWYASAPANYYAKFWHDHSEGGLAYGFCYDDVADQSSTIMETAPEHMVFTIRW